jgi:hypothetical protein
MGHSAGRGYRAGDWGEQAGCVVGRGTGHAKENGRPATPVKTSRRDRAREPTAESWTAEGQPGGRGTDAPPAFGRM